MFNKTSDDMVSSLKIQKIQTGFPPPDEYQEGIIEEQYEEWYGVKKPHTVCMTDDRILDLQTLLSKKALRI
jgi:hypothetical protein